jgi:hypothetical protein
MKLTLTKLTLAATLAAATLAAAPAYAQFKDADWQALGTMDGYNRVFARMTANVTPALDGVCNKNLCVTHWYGPGFVATREETGEGGVFLGSQLCAPLSAGAGTRPSRVCVNNKGEAWAEARSDYGWSTYQYVRGAFQG